MQGRRGAGEQARRRAAGAGPAAPHQARRRLKGPARDFLKGSVMRAAMPQSSVRQTMMFLSSDWLAR